MDSRVVQSQVHENDEHQPHNVDSQQVTHGGEEPHFDLEKKSVLNKVKAKARRIKDTIKKHSHHVLDHGHENNNEDHHIHDDRDLDEDTEVHESPVKESEAVKSATPTSQQVENSGKSGINLGGPTVMGEESYHDPPVVGVSSTNEINQNIATDQAKTFAGEEKPEQCKDNLEKPMGLEEDPHEQESRTEAYTLPNYQTKVTDPSGAGSDEIKDITPVVESFERMNVQDEPRHTPEPKVLSTVADTEYPSAGSHDQFVPNLSAESDTKTQYPSDGSESHDQFALEMISSNINRDPEIASATEQTSNTITTPVEEQPRHEPVETQSNQNSYKDKISLATADKTVSPENTDEISLATADKTVSPENAEEISLATADKTVSPENTQEISLATADKTVSPENADEISIATADKTVSPENAGEISLATADKTVSPENAGEISLATADKTVSPENAEAASNLGYDEKEDRNDKVMNNEQQHKSADASNMSGSTSEQGKNITQSLTDKLAPVYEQVAGVGSAVKSKVYGTNTGGVGTETKNEVIDKDKGVSVKEYLAEKLRPGEEDKALSEVISEALHKRKEKPVEKEREEKSKKECEESNMMNGPGKGVVDKVKGVVGSWFAKPSENQSPQVAGGEDLIENKNSGAEVEQVSQVVNERRTQE